jgi:hypothetical protein
MIGATIRPASIGCNGRAISSGGMSWMCGCVVRTRLRKFACRLDSIADMKTMTATPIATAVKMKIVCIRPSRKNRSAAIHSNGAHVFMVNEPSWSRP